ncbi:imelysin family protein [Pararhizobium sp. IMCC21322]|uniref:imelysin family protein n=1 Tax=Pararhizobium sp. IMCC21322 TaxID=3067903 RepID=UPI00274256EF|nr:imelysin family protein [Pararhizobium sp. IMCC21322]
MPIAIGKDIEQLNAKDMVSDLITNVIRPGFADLERSAATMSQQINTYCEAPTEAGYSNVHEAFDGLLARWGRVEFIRLGPLGADSRLERMLFWPDRRGRGLKQVRDIIRLADKTVLDPEFLVQKSVAVQGLLALEYTLFSDDAEIEMAAADSHRCVYATAIASAVAQLTGELSNLWQAEGDTSISHIWLNPSPINALFRDEAEQFSAVLEILEDGLEIVSHQRLEPVLRDDMASARPKSALFWRSGNTIPSLKANFDGFEAVMKSAQLERRVEGDDRRIISSLNFELGNAKRAVANLDKPLPIMLSEKETYNRLTYVRLVVDSMLTITRDMIKPIFGLSSGFSSLDGD